MKSIIWPRICNPCTRSIQTKNTGLKWSCASRRDYSVVQDARPFRLAVIGSGPAGFYTAYKVLSKMENSKVDMYEQLPVPYGLVRFGVAPDHPEVKNCQEKFEEVAQSPDFEFVGNIAIGDQAGQLPLRALMPHYDAVLFAYGASKDKILGVPGEDTVKSIHSARAFVGWYNGLPEYADLKPDLTQGEEAIIIGQGNVALDVARILLQDTSVLRLTDITENAIQTLQKSKVRRVRVIGRRGPMQAAFTIKEIRELVRLPSVAFHPLDAALIPDIKRLSRVPRRIMEVLIKGSNAQVGSVEKSWSLDFCLSPTSFNSNLPSSQLSSISFEKTNLTPNLSDPVAKANGTGEFVHLSSSMAFRSIGYKSEALPGFSELGIPFDNRLGIIKNDYLGRVVETKERKAFKGHRPSLYCAGWVKRGPTGVIASTMADAFSTANAIEEDWTLKSPFFAATSSTGLGWEGIKKEAEGRGCRRVSWQEWQKIDAVEKSKGHAKGKEREKFTRREDMLAVLD